MTDNGWDASAQAWIASLGDEGDFGRRYVLDAPMLDWAGTPATALDVGCGEGRFCRMLKARGVAATGVDPTRALIAEARRRDPEGAYLEAGAEALPFSDDAFDLVVSYLALIDIDDVPAAIAEMVRVLAPGGRLLVANLNGFNTAGSDRGFVRDALGRVSHYPVDHYLTARPVRVAWKGISIINHHRPLSFYMALFLEAGLQLERFDEPAPSADAPAEKAERHRRAPYFCMMRWSKPSLRKPQG